MDDRALLEIAARQHDLVTRPDVERARLTSAQWCRRVDLGIWVEAATGVWHHAAVRPTWELRVRAGAKSLGPLAALFGPTAAAWWQLEGSPRASVEFVVERSRRFVAGRLRVHTTTAWDHGDLLVHDGVRCTTVTRTIIDLATVRASPRSIEAAIDSGIRTRLTSVPTLRRRIGQLASRGRPGTELLRELMLDSGGESFLERRFLRLMRAGGIARPDCQIVHRRGPGAIRVDFQFPGTRLVVEVSGRVGHASDADRRKDARRRNHLASTGHELVEFTTADVVEDPDYVMSTVREAVARTRHAPSGMRPVGE